jgi:hypothetical protein
VLMDEIKSFVAAVRGGLLPEVTGEDGKRALEVAVEISRNINERNESAGSRSVDLSRAPH